MVLKQTDLATHCTPNQTQAQPAKPSAKNLSIAGTSTTHYLIDMSQLDQVASKEIHVPSGPITRARAKKIQKAMNALVKKFLGVDMGFKEGDV